MASAASHVLLAETWSEEIDPTDWWMSEKLDGVRAYWSGSNFYSRQGNLFHVPDFFKEKLPKVPLDGELWCGRGLFQKCISIVKKQANKVVPEDYKLITYLIFDAPSHGGKYEDRVKFLKANIPENDDKCYATVVGIKKCEGMDHLKRCLADVNNAGGEGIMLRKPGSLYENKRSSTLLKVKTFYDEEALVVGHKPGKGNCTGMLGALECELPNGKRFDCGSGFNMSQRKKPPKIGSVITFKYQELSNNGHPRFPVYLRPRTDLTWADVLESAKTKTPKTSIQKVIPSTKLSKQHSVLFSVIPSRDTAGKKIVTSDDEDEDEKSGKSKSPPSTSATTTSADTRKPCQYGAKCYRTNPDHFKQFQHPPKTSTAASGSDVVKKESPSSTKAAASNGENKPKQVCAFGAQCFRKSAVHLAMYSHPAKNASEDEVDRAAQEEIIDTKELIEPEEPQSPTDDTNGFFVKDKNKGIVFDDDAEDEDMEDTTTMVTRSKKEWDTLQKTVREQDERLVKLQNTLKSMDTKTAVKRPSPCRDVDDDTEAKKSKKV